MLIPLTIRRYGGNVYEGDVIEQTAELYPGAIVKKIGRTTGTRKGCVNGYLLQEWSGSESTYEVAIIGDDTAFADVGDSGGCVFVVDSGGMCKAAGMLIGKNRVNDIALATPLSMILDSAGEYEWA